MTPAGWYNRDMGTPATGGAGAATGRGHSVWLMPDGAEGELLGGWIRRLAERYRTEPFPPHVTVVSALDAPVAELLGSTERAAAGLSPFTVHVDGVDGREEHFRCVFVQAVDAGPLRAAQASVAAAFAREPDSDFFPHLSLVYGALRPEQKHGLAHEVGGDVNVRFVAWQLHLWSTEGPLADWRELGVFPFGRP